MSPLSLVSPRPPCCLQSSYLLLHLQSHCCGINIGVTPALICLFQVSELQSQCPAFQLIISYQALKTGFYFYCSDPVMLPDPSVEETWHLHYTAQISVLKRPHTKELMVPIFIRFITGGEGKQSHLPTGYSVNSSRQRGEICGGGSVFQEY